MAPCATRAYPAIRPLIIPSALTRVSVVTWRINLNIVEFSRRRSFDGSALSPWHRRAVEIESSTVDHEDIS
eukprot:5826233-Pyramimonas_sp.AAC.1